MNHQFFTLIMKLWEKIVFSTGNSNILCKNVTKGEKSQFERVKILNLFYGHLLSNYPSVQLRRSWPPPPLNCRVLQKRFLQTIILMNLRRFIIAVACFVGFPNTLELWVTGLHAFLLPIPTTRGVLGMKIIIINIQNTSNFSILPLVTWLIKQNQTSYRYFIRHLYHRAYICDYSLEHYWLHIIKIEVI